MSVGLGSASMEVWGPNGGSCLSSNLIMQQEMLIHNGQAGSATDVEKFLAAGNITFANSETTMSLGNIRLHLRIMRRLSLAVIDPANPTFTDCGLDYLEKLEMIYGRRVSQTALLESGRTLDAFTSGVTDFTELRSAIETLFYLSIRGHSLKRPFRQAGETAKVLSNVLPNPRCTVPAGLKV